MARSSQRNFAAAPKVDPRLGPSMGSGVRGPRQNAVSPPSGVRTRPEPDPVRARLPQRPDQDAGPQPTRVSAPDVSLLALTRAEGRGVRRFAWFLFGALAGASAVWCVTRDVKTDVYAARLWAARELRSLHGHDDAADPPVNPPPPAPSAAPRPLVTAPPIPMIDVERLPRAPAPLPPSNAPSTGAPALAHAPGPR